MGLKMVYSLKIAMLTGKTMENGWLLGAITLFSDKVKGVDKFN
jgi:hypothetical protein